MHAGAACAPRTPVSAVARNVSGSYRWFQCARRLPTENGVRNNAPRSSTHYVLWRRWVPSVSHDPTDSDNPRNAHATTNVLALHIIRVHRTSPLQPPSISVIYGSGRQLVVHWKIWTSFVMLWVYDRNIQK